MGTLLFSGKAASVLGKMGAVFSQGPFHTHSSRFTFSLLSRFGPRTEEPEQDTSTPSKSGGMGQSGEGGHVDHSLCCCLSQHLRGPLVCYAGLLARKAGPFMGLCVSTSRKSVMPVSSLFPRLRRGSPLPSPLPLSSHCQSSLPRHPQDLRHRSPLGSSRSPCSHLVSTPVMQVSLPTSLFPGLHA